MRTNRLLSLDIEGLRNIERTRLDADAPAIWLFGANGAGKSSLLEAIYLLARGRSYRGRKFGPLVNRDASRAFIKGRFTFDPEVSIEVRHLQSREGVQREVLPPGILDAEWQDAWIPTKLVTDNPQALIEGDPQLRRLFLDWNALLWNKTFRGCRHTFQRVLLQRNAALKARWNDAAEWDSAFVEASQAVDRLRGDFLAGLREHFQTLKSGFSFLDDIELEYDRGWPSGLGLPQAMAGVRSQEMTRGFSLLGPHRADFSLSREGVRASLSRGQMKVVVCLLQLACEQMHRAEGATASIWMLDDVEAELDEENAGKLWRLFSESGSQILATGVSREPKALVPRDSFAMFHVEHGVLTRAD